ncbi:DUF4251 domain-containing protein [Antarcticibacterium arcticum]|uniref:DUF4251 domain-containing protein n=1 Tax=Antarcticibacterium arcticum TaxID=2585771 RepID=A0A5B8YG81_9FLAO|nr:DUF4251 domain-containing protein [Antarcticibacterium arcticum]QED36935.1 DUF4251 domain-containing protein [Antarcticibacterium arcticum]
MKSISGLFILSFIILLSAGCGSSKVEGGDQNYDALLSLVNSREFEIEQEWAIPLSGNTINLLGNPNYIRFKGNQVDLFLPYYGVRQSGGEYGGGDGGIKYVGPAEKLVIEENTRQNNIQIKFEGRQGTEDLQFFISLMPGGNTHTSVNSSERTAISYRGNVKVLK